MTVTKKELIDMAWRTRGLQYKLDVKGDHMANWLRLAQAIALWKPELKGILPIERPTREQGEAAYWIMNDLSREHCYGVR